MQNILVTGGAGFIGSNFVEKLFDNTSSHNITVLDVLTYAANPENIPERIRTSNRFKFVKGNICDAEVVNPLVKDSDLVVHFAAESHVTRSIADDKPFFETDVMGTQTIAAAVSRSRVKRFVHISTSEVYGTAVWAPMDEQHPLNPCTPYAAAKAGADRLVYAYRETYGIPTVIIRPFNNYGPKQHLEKMVPRFVTSALLGEPLAVHGDGKMTRDWIYVGDTCEAILKAVTRPFNAPFYANVLNVGTGIDTSVLTIAEMILDLVPGTNSKIVNVSPRPGQVDRHISSTSLAYSVLDWKAEVRLYEGLRKTVEWYRNNPMWWAEQRKTAEVSVTDSARKLSGSY